MKYQCPLLAVKDLEVSKQFYKEVLGLKVILDCGANVTLTGGVALQTIETWSEFLQKGQDEIRFCGNDTEICFEEDDFDGFIKKLEALGSITYVHPVFEHRWGQRVVRFYDPDGHIIEVGENMKLVCKRFLNSGMTVEETAQRMDVPIKYVKAHAK